MSTSIVIVMLLLALSGCQSRVTDRANLTDGDTSRVLGGTEAIPHEFPWMVSLYPSVGCGACLISDGWVLTAAHCSKGNPATDIYVVVGEHDRNDPNDEQERIRVDQKFEHPSFDSESFDYDFSLLKLSRPARLSKNVQPISLPSPSQPIPDGQLATVTGWGLIDSEGPLASKLQKVTVRTMTSKECNSRYNFGVTARMICANDDNINKGSCKGDSGGPLTLSIAGVNIVIGVVSWGRGTCTSSTRPGVHARVASVTDWINRNIGSPGSDPVSCGRHIAPSCEECPQGHGASWCNGKCHWENSSCKPEPVSCGQHMAPSCGECPQGHGASWCNGKCHWENSSCKPELVSCGQHMAPSCGECPQGHGASWCNGKCHWENSSCKPV